MDSSSSAALPIHAILPIHAHDPAALAQAPLPLDLDLDLAPPSDPPFPDMALRSLVSTKEAGIVIGKAGSSVAHIRDVSNVKIAVSKVIPGVSERILTISGQLPGIAQAYAMIAKNILDCAHQAGPAAIQNAVPSHHQHFLHGNANPAFINSSDSDTACVRLLVSHQLVGSIIGKGGSKIREIQESSAAKIVVSKEMLPQSTERVVEIHGSVDAVNRSVFLVGQCIRVDADRPTTIIPYDPQNAIRSSNRDGSNNSGGRRYPNLSSVGRHANDMSGNDHHHHHQQQQHHHQQHHQHHQQPHQQQSQLPQTSRTLMVPADMVGCIIGKSGSFINQIRRLSGARLHIAEQLEGHTEREVTISGTDQANQKALNLLFNQLEAEKERRSKQQDHQQARQQQAGGVVHYEHVSNGNHGGLSGLPDAAPAAGGAEMMDGDVNNNVDLVDDHLV